MKTLKFKYTTSRGRNSYGYNICSLWVDNEKVSSNDDQEKPKILDEPLSIDDDEIPF